MEIFYEIDFKLMENLFKGVARENKIKCKLTFTGMTGRIHFHFLSGRDRESMNQCILSLSLSPRAFAFAYRKEEINVKIKRENKIYIEREK